MFDSSIILSFPLFFSSESYLPAENPKHAQSTESTQRSKHS